MPKAAEKNTENAGAPVEAGASAVVETPPVAPAPARETYVCPARPGRHLIFLTQQVEFVQRPGGRPHVKQVVPADARRLNPETEIRADAAAELLEAGAIQHCTKEGKPLK